MFWNNSLLSYFLKLFRAKCDKNGCSVSHSWHPSPKHKTFLTNSIPHSNDYLTFVESSLRRWTYLTCSNKSHTLNWSHPLSHFPLENSWRFLKASAASFLFPTLDFSPRKNFSSSSLKGEKMKRRRWWRLFVRWLQWKKARKRRKKCQSFSFTLFFFFSSFSCWLCSYFWS